MADKEIFQAVTMEVDAGKALEELNKDVNNFLKNN